MNGRSVFFTPKTVRPFFSGYSHASAVTEHSNRHAFVLLNSQKKGDPFQALRVTVLIKAIARVDFKILGKPDHPS